MRDEDCPLVLALMASTHIQFVLKVYQEGSDLSTISANEEKSKLHPTNSFFAAMKKKLNKSKSKDKVCSLFWTCLDLSRCHAEQNSIDLQ